MRTLHWAHNPAVSYLSVARAFLRTSKKCLGLAHIALKVLFYVVVFGWLAYIFYFGFPLPLLITWFVTVVIALRFPRIFVGILVFLDLLIAFGLMFYIVNSLIAEGF